MLESSDQGKDAAPKKVVWRELNPLFPKDRAELERIMGLPLDPSFDVQDGGPDSKLQRLRSYVRSGSERTKLRMVGLYVGGTFAGYMCFRIKQDGSANILSVDYLQVEPNFRNIKTINAFLRLLRDITEKYRASIIKCEAGGNTKSMYELLSEGRYNETTETYSIPAANLQTERLRQLLKERALKTREDIRQRIALRNSNKQDEDESLYDPRAW